MDIKGKATVTLTVEIQTEDVWGGDCTVGQLYEQAAESAIQDLTRILGLGSRIKIVGEPKVTGILTDKA